MAESITRKNIDLDTLDYYDGKIKNYVDNKVGTGSLTIDDTLSDTSTNPVQNKVVKQAIDNKADKSLYGDTTINVGRLADSTVGNYSTAEGSETEASGEYSHAEGADAIASGKGSHAEGYCTTAIGNYSHAEGQNTIASGEDSHAEGYYTTASGIGSHTEGSITAASGIASHAEGYNTTASGNGSHAEGSNYDSSGTAALSDRTATISNVDYTISGSTAYGVNSHAEGTQSFAYGYSSHAEGGGTTASGSLSHAEGYNTTASGDSSHAEGESTTASGVGSHAEGYNTTASKTASHAEGAATTASGSNAHAEGGNTTASGDNSHAEGNSNYKVTQLITDFSGDSTTNDDIINAWNTKKFSVACGKSSHVEGQNNLSLGHYSHAEGLCTVAIGNQSHTSGYYTKALHDNEAAYGKYNESNDNTLFSIGDGTADDARHNAFEITTTGGKLHDKDIATTDLIPTTLPANGGDADTVDGLHANNFTQIIDFGFTETDTKTAIGQLGKTAIYRCSKWTDYPSGCYDGQGTVIAINYNGAGTAGVNTMWVRQIFITPHGSSRSPIYMRCISDTTVGNWEEISTTPIKSTVINGTTNADGACQLGMTIDKYQVLAIVGNTSDEHDLVFTPWVWGLPDPNPSVWGFSVTEFSDPLTKKPNIPFSITVYYVEL